MSDPYANISAGLKAELGHLIADTVKAIISMKSEKNAAFAAVLTEEFRRRHPTGSWMARYRRRNMCRDAVNAAARGEVGAAKAKAVKCGLSQEKVNALVALIYG